MLTGTTTRNASSGVAVFTGLSITQPGTGYTLTAASAGLTSVTSTRLTSLLHLSPWRPHQHQCLQVIHLSSHGRRFPLQLIEIGSDYMLPEAATLPISIGCMSIVARSPSVPIASGSCSFPISSSRPPGTYEFRLLPNDTYTRIATSNAVTVFTVSGAATKLAFIVQPANATAGSALAGPPSIVVQDSLGNTITTSTASITVEIASNPGSGILTGTATKNAVAGVAAFTGLSITQPGTGYTLTATSSGLTTVTSTLFNVTSSSVSLATTPTSVPAGASFTVTWTQIANATNRDWIGLYAPGSSDTAYLDWMYVNCSPSPTVPIASGTCSFPISSSRPPGTYEFRLLPNDTYTRIATSNAVTVTAAINKLAISVSQNITAGTPGFSMVVESRSPVRSCYQCIKQYCDNRERQDRHGNIRRNAQRDDPRRNQPGNDWLSDLYQSRERRSAYRRAHQWRHAHCGRHCAVHCLSWCRGSTRFYHSTRKRRSQEHNSWAANGNGTRQCRQYRHVLDPLDQHRNRDQPRCWNSQRQHDRDFECER